MFILSKIFAIFLNPLIWIFLCLFFIWRIKNTKKKKYFTIVWVFFTFVLTNNFIFYQCLERYEAVYKPLPKEKVYDCAIVLGGASSYDSFSSCLQLNNASERLLEPVILYRKGIVKKLLISGGSATVFPPYIKDAIYVRKFWLELGIPDKDILIETESRNTIENAKYSKALIEKKAIGNNILLITSALHMPRSQFIFKKMGMNYDIYPVDFGVRRLLDDPFNLENFILPKISALEGWEALIHEWIGLLFAKI